VSTAEVAILTTGAVGLGTPAIAAFFQWLRDKGAAAREREAKDLDELRALLDELSAACYRHATKLISLEKWMQRSFLSLPNPTKAPNTTGTRRELYTLNARLVIRRGRDDRLVKSLGNFLRRTDEAVKEIGDLWTANEPFDYDDDQLDQRAHSYWEAYERFVDESKEIAGSTL